MLKPYSKCLFLFLTFSLVLLTVPYIGKTSNLSFSGSHLYAQEDGAAEPTPAPAEAEEGEEHGDEPALPGQSYLVWFFTSMGPTFTIIFGVMSVTFVSLTVMNWLTINRNQIMPKDFVDKFKEKLDSADFQDAYEFARENESTQAKIVAAGLAKMQSGYEASQRAMSDIAEEEIMALEHRLGYISLIAGIAPMVGLLGTVVGMISAFQTIATAGTAPQASELAGTISFALITTEVGLFIAIPALVVYEVFRNKLALIVLELTIQTENLMNRFNTK
ncbi:MAG: MotA/TolQ/ExbB proton channel family protein [Planctomycetaceae bacterium]|nr:MotA/TolQ/ExbB proton channel family protein [Planctomycetaceae bacterium]